MRFRAFPVTMMALSVVALALYGAAPIVAQTPDGLPPARETVCDAETGAAFGWCNAYCEAMDCELANDNDPLTEPKASANACTKVRTKFQQQTGRDMPCEVSCPCTDNPEQFPLWAAYLAGELSGQYCLLDGQFCEAIFGVPPEFCSPPEGDLTYIIGDYPDFFEIIASSLGLPFFDLNFAFCGDSSGVGIIPVTPEQGVLCKEQLDAALAASGQVCGVLPP